MFLVLDGNSEHVAHASRKIGLSREKKNRFVAALDLIKCLKQKKKQRLVLKCAPELPSYIRTMTLQQEKQLNILQIKVNFICLEKKLCTIISNSNIFRFIEKNEYLQKNFELK